MRFDLLNYDRDSGKITDLCGNSVEFRHPKGYMYVSYKNKKMLSHRAAWIMTYGVVPEDQIDHINGIPDDNRIENLRLATAKQNAQSIAKFKNNSSGVTGVHWHSRDQKWHASISSNGKRYFLGSFSSIRDAEEARISAKNRLHEFQPRNRINHEEGTKLSF